MRIADFQERVDHWIKTIGVRYFDPMTNTAILTEEVGEVARLMARIYGEQSFKKELSPEEQKEALAQEMADVLWVLGCLANQCDIDLTQAIEANFDKKTTRDINRHRENKKL